MLFFQALLAPVLYALQVFFMLKIGLQEAENSPKGNSINLSFPRRRESSDRPVIDAQGRSGFPPPIRVEGRLFAGMTTGSIDANTLQICYYFRSLLRPFLLG